MPLGTGGVLIASCLPPLTYLHWVAPVSAVPDRHTWHSTLPSCGAKKFLGQRVHTCHARTHARTLARTHTHTHTQSVCVRPQAQSS